MKYEISGLANHAKENRINWSAPRRCTLGKRHIYINGICGCGKMSKAQEIKNHNEARREIEAYERQAKQSTGRFLNEMEHPSKL